MGEEPISERLEWIRTRYFKQKQQMAAAIGCTPPRLTKLLSRGDHNIKASLVMNLFTAMKELQGAKVAADGITPGWIMFGGPRSAPQTETPQHLQLNDQSSASAWSLLSHGTLQSAMADLSRPGLHEDALTHLEALVGEMRRRSKGKLNSTEDDQRAERVVRAARAESRAEEKAPR